MTLLYTCSNLPTGASLASSGRLIVLPTAVAGTTALSITITDSVTGDVTSGTVSLVVSSLVTATYFGLQLPIAMGASFALTASVAVAAQTLSVIDIALTANTAVLQQIVMSVDFALTAVVCYSAAGLPVNFVLTAANAPGSFSAAAAAVRSSAGMTQIASTYLDDGNMVLPDLGFSIPVYGGSYRTNIFIGSNSYLTFGYGSSLYNSLSLTSPGLALMLAAADRAWNSVYVNQDSAKSYRILWVGSDTGNVNPYSWQVVLWADGTIEFAYSGAFPANGVKSLTKGDGLAHADFATTAGVAGSFVFSPVDAAASSYTVQAGSYVSNAPATALAGSTAQPQILAGSLAIGNLLTAAVAQPQILAGSLAVSNSLIAAVAQPQVLGGSLINVLPGLSSYVAQSQTLGGSLVIGKLLAGQASQPQTLGGTLAVRNLVASSVSQPQTLGGSLAVSKLLVSPVSQPQSLAGVLTASVPGRNTALLNAVSYAALNNATYGYYDSLHQMPQLYDGNLTSGMMGQAIVNAEAIYVQVQLATASFVNQLVFYGGQFNGNYNVPDSVKVYAGLVGAGTAATPIYSNGALAYSATGQTLSLAAIAAFDAPFTQLTFAFALGGQYLFVSVNELQIQGYGSFAGNIAQPQSLAGALSVA